MVVVTLDSVIGHVLVGRYRVEDLRSDGTATAPIFQAEDLEESKKVAVRLMTVASLFDKVSGLIDEEAALAAFDSSMQQLHDISHPTLVSIDDWGDSVMDGVKIAFSVTQHFAQGSLREYLDRGRRLTPSQALIVGLDVCRALHHAHKNGFVHGDVRPANLIFGDDGRIRLAGLGIKRSFVAAKMSIEQARYAAPEIGQGSVPDMYSDVYSLAITLLETITGEVPFAAESVAITLANRIDKLLPVSGGLGPIAAPIERAGRPVASERGTALEFGQALAQVADKMPRPQPIDTITSKRFEDVITRPNLITKPNPTRAQKVVETPSSFERAVDQAIAEEETYDSPQIRRRFTRIWISVAAAALVIVSIIAFQSLVKSSHQIPELGGVAEAQARNKIAGFDWDLIVRAERTNDVEFGQVIRTEPASGVSLKEGEVLVLVVSEGPPLGVLTDVTGESRASAEEKLAAQGLTVEAKEDSSETVAVGNVISWSVAKQPSLVAGDEVLKGTLISLTISNGPALRTVPMIIGLSVADATAKVAELGLILALTPDVFNNDVAIGLIGGQLPLADEKLPRGGALGYSMSLGPDFVVMPNIVGINFNDAEKRLVAAGFVVGEVTGRKSYRMKSASVKGVAINNGDKVPRGSLIDMVFP